MSPYLGRVMVTAIKPPIYTWEFEDCLSTKANEIKPVTDTNSSDISPQNRAVYSFTIKKKIWCFIANLNTHPQYTYLNKEGK